MVVRFCAIVLVPRPKPKPVFGMATWATGANAAARYRMDG